LQGTPLEKAVNPGSIDDLTLLAFYEELARKRAVRHQGPEGNSTPSVGPTAQPTFSFRCPARQGGAGDRSCVTGDHHPFRGLAVPGPRARRSGRS
ncbi:hypothetical protein, partial [Streptomyces griseofuscus]|uniref:hypothetical protein n=1 Tax=Streptomyces griseofuscus TaxID=146922 RepID=UPI00340B51E6